MKPKRFFFKRPLFLFAALLLFSASFSSSATAKSAPHDNPFDPTSIIQGLGFSPITPQSLPSLSFPSMNLGKDVSLTDYKGKWLFLVFWATWCGPCTYEIPIIETLYQELPKEQIAVLGISIDRDEKSIRKFLDKNKVNFPILWDQSGKASQFFNASSVPLVYLVSPESQVVALFRGANNWEEPSTLAALKELVSHQGPLVFNSATKSPALQNRESLSLAEELLAPEMTFEIEKKDLFPHDIFYGEVAIIWKGDSQKYLLKVPKITLPSEIKELSVSSYSEASGEYAKTTYRYQFQIEKEGSYKIGPVEMEFSPRRGGTPQFSRVSDITLEVSPSFLKKHGLVGGALTLFFLFVAGGALIYLRRKKEKNRSIHNVQQKREKLRSWPERFELLKAGRTRKDSRDYSVELVSFWKEYSIFQKKDFREQDLILENIKFAGKIFTNAEITYFEKQLDQEFKTIIEDETMEDKK